MKLIFKVVVLLVVIFTVFTLASCDDESESTDNIAGQIEIKFDNAVDSINPGSLISKVGNKEYRFENAENGQQYNIYVLRYFISEIKFEGANGLVYKEEMAVSASETKGIHLIDESKVGSLRFEVSNVPPGEYDKVSFKVGIDSGIVAQGAAGGILSQGGGAKDTDMFWNWNNGYLAFKMEGNAKESTGNAEGETVKIEDSNGYAFHIGGWSSTMNNNKVIELAIDKIDVKKNTKPEVHIVMDVNEVMTNQSVADFTVKNNIHTPASGAAMANNLKAAFKFDHIH